ncbi:hypothetical protein [Singulisphaera sp. PoT]|uniref:hypothetical protein n=1 Tax=Singulisphaera sp. PoT TaxID=3411797 RepID=UPI003BF468A9
MSARREILAFAATLAVVVSFLFAESLLFGKVLSPADVLRASASFRQHPGEVYEPANRLLMDPVLQFQPWLEFSRAMIRNGHLPLWNEWSGCGAPHLANGQSAIFDPFQVIAYVGRLPDAYAWMAAARLWTAGLGMFLLARAWGLGAWGRWFVGLAFPLCGFLIVWLLFPVTNVAIWMPWLLLATDRALDRPAWRSLGTLAIATGLVLLGGHVQTSAHVLLATGFYTVWRWWSKSSLSIDWRKVAFWGAGISLGIVIAAIEIIPLGFYLAKSPVWEDRVKERRSPWKLSKPHILDAACTALPYIFGSQRQGHPHLGKAFGVYNLNESAGGFAGLASLLWLAPLGWAARRQASRVWFLAGLGIVGALGAFALPPVDNLLRALPVLNVTDNRRLSLWVAFALVMLAGIGLDHLEKLRAYCPKSWLWIAGSLLLLLGAIGVGRLEPRLRHRAEAHYQLAAKATPGADVEEYRRRADHQVDLTMSFYPRYLGLAAGHLLILAVLAGFWRRGRLPAGAVQAALFSLTMVDLLGFGYGLNPAIARSEDRITGPVVDFLRKNVPASSRVLGVGEELPPNCLMRYGLHEVRNYDSVELTRNLDWFSSLYEGKEIRRDSRRAISWESALRAQDALREASIGAIVGVSRPPPSPLWEAHQIGAVWVVLCKGAPWADHDGPGNLSEIRRVGNKITLDFKFNTSQNIIVREMFDPSWRASLDDEPWEVRPYRGTFLGANVPKGSHRLELRYAPGEIPYALAASIFGLTLSLFALTAPRPFRSTRIIVRGLGRTQATELKSVLSSSSA